MLTVMLEVVTQPPFGSAVIVDTDSNGRPSTTHDTSAGGLLRSVLHRMVTWSPALASLGPRTFTLDGATVNETILRFGVGSNQSPSKVLVSTGSGGVLNLHYVYT